jgi:ribosome biogenesis GTPase A
MNIEDVALCLLAYTNDTADQNNNNKIRALDIPVWTDGSEYSIDNLQEDQKQAMAVVIQYIKKYCEGDLEKHNITMQLTVTGVAGSGKSTWINTLVTLVRRLFKCSNAIGVYIMAQQGVLLSMLEEKPLTKGFK